MKYLSEDERVDALNEAYLITKRNLERFCFRSQNSHTINGRYEAIDNVKWTTGFYPGLLWLLYDYTKDESLAYSAGFHVESFYNRALNRIEVDHHDMGFLYTPSCVSCYKIKGWPHSKEAALMAADLLLERFQEKGEFFQAWGRMGEKDNYRFIIDCLLNLPLLYWASDETGDPIYREKAILHTKTCINNSFRPDGSTFHTFFMNMESGESLRGETCQGYKADSSWARGQAWGIYGLALCIKHTKDYSLFPLFEKTLDYFISRLPDDKLPYWDLIFTSGSEERDSSSGAIAASGLLEAEKIYREIGKIDDANRVRKLAQMLLKSIYDNCLIRESDKIDGLISHATYSKKSPYNSCTEEGVDASVSWGDYYWVEALIKLSSSWREIW